MSSYIYILLFAGLFFSFIYAATETGFYCLNRIRLRYREERGWWTAKIINSMLNDPQGMVCTVLIGNNIANYVAAAVFTYMVGTRVTHVKAELVATLMLAPIILIFCEILPKSIFQRHADSLLYKVVPIADVSYKVFYPIVFLLRIVSRLPHLFLKGIEAKESPFFSPQRLRYFLEEGTEVGTVSMYQNIMARNIMTLGTTPIHKVMIPLEEVTMAPDTVGHQSLKVLAKEKKFSRIPVYDRERTKIIGIVTLLDFLMNGKLQADIHNFVREATYIDANTPVDDALLKLRHARQRMGIVTDREGKAIGIVTIKDLVEEIVGELTVW
ncbi:MAG: CNNM domain-containing protein [Candidatus Brocadiales bacterium]